MKIFISYIKHHHLCLRYFMYSFWLLLYFRCCHDLSLMVNHETWYHLNIHWLINFQICVLNYQSFSKYEKGTTTWWNLLREKGKLPNFAFLLCLQFVTYSVLEMHNIVNFKTRISLNLLLKLPSVVYLTLFFFQMSEVVKCPCS